MVFKHFGTWIEVLNNFEKLLILRNGFLIHCEMIINAVLLGKVTMIIIGFT